MITFKQYLFENDKFTGRYVFHETHIDSAVNIIKQGRIKGIWIDNPRAKKDMLDDPEMEADYGNYVYTSTFNQDHTDFSYYGVTENHVLFVIDVKKLLQAGEYLTQYENGLYRIPNTVPLTAVVFVLIGGYESEEDERLHVISGACLKYNIDFEWVEDEPHNKRLDIINRFKNKRY